MRNGKALLLSLIAGFFVFSSALAANSDVDAILGKWNTFSNSEHLNTDYTLTKTLNFADKKAYAIVYDAPEGENKRFYRYLFVNEAGEFLYEISLGSYDATTEIDREMGNIGENDRLYHLDVYCPGEKNDQGVIERWGSHETLGFMTVLPEFESLTQNIQEKEEGQNRCDNKQ